MKIKGRKQKRELAAATDTSLKLLAEFRAQEAFEYLAEAVQRFPSDPELRLLYGTSLLAVRPEDGVSETIKAIELDPDNPMRLARAAGILFKMGRVDTARSYVARAKRLAPPNFLFAPDLIYLDSHFAALDGNDDVAEKGFRLALKQEPSGEMFAFDLAKFLAERGRRAEALHVIDEALPRAKQREPLDRLRDELLAETEPD